MQANTSRSGKRGPPSACGCPVEGASNVLLSVSPTSKKYTFHTKFRIAII